MKPAATAPGRSKPFICARITRKPAEAEARNGIAAIEEFRQAVARAPGHRQRRTRRVRPALNWLAVANYCHAILNSAEFSFID